jgi:SAM-dependent methyltransferase
VNEASKTRALWGPREREWLRGNGLDIGCGPDPILPGVRPFDVGDGDANEITEYVSDSFDFVFSSHCLEHMHDPRHALGQWWQLVRPGGHLIVIVPDEDLYEQGYFPSVFNPDHKATFTLSKNRSWSPRSYNLLDLVRELPGGTLVAIEMQDEGLDRRLLGHARIPLRVARAFARIRAAFHARMRWPAARKALDWSFRILGIPVDQTLSAAVAQIQAVVRKAT